MRKKQALPNPTSQFFSCNVNPIFSPTPSFPPAKSLLNRAFAADLMIVQSPAYSSITSLVKLRPRRSNSSKLTAPTGSRLRHWQTPTPPVSFVPSCLKSPILPIMRLNLASLLAKSVRLLMKQMLWIMSWATLQPTMCRAAQNNLLKANGVFPRAVMARAPMVSLIRQQIIHLPKRASWHQSWTGPTIVSRKLIPDVFKLHMRGLKNGKVVEYYLILN